MFDAADDSNVWGLAPASGIQHRFADYSYRMVDRLISDGFFEDIAGALCAIQLCPGARVRACAQQACA